MADYWRDKHALVTGGSSGLGRALATELSARGARLLIMARKQRALNETSESLRATGTQVLTLAGDVTVPSDIERLRNLIDKEWGGLDFVCHCAGQSMRGDALATTPEQFVAMWDVNFLSAVQVTRATADLLTASRGHLVLIGSLACKVAPRYMGAYPASKFPLAAYAQQLRLQWATEGPHVLLVCPGPLALEGADKRYQNSSPEGVPTEARRAGGGAKVGKIEPERLCQQILAASERRTAEIVVPKRARLLFALSQLSPRLGDWLLSRNVET